MQTTIERHLKRFKRDRRGISNIIVVALSLIIITLIVSNIVLWSYQMNQLDWEKMREDIKITNVSAVTRSSWFVTQNEYTRNIGTLVSGNYTNTQVSDGSYERFSEEIAPSSCYPSAYSLIGSTSYVSGSLTDLQSDNGVYMSFRSYPSTSTSQTLYAHQETTSIGGTTYRLQSLSSGDQAGTSLTVSTDTNGRKLAYRFVYSLACVSSISASTWTIYYRAIKSSPAVDAHADVNILVRRADGTVRTTIATNVANSGALTTSWSTLSGTYSWAAYTVVDQTDYLEIDYYIEVTTSSSTKTASLRIDDNTLAVTQQTRASNIFLPSEYTSEVEFTGLGNTESWTQITWTIDSAWTTGSISVTLQLYNSTLGGYPTSGNGYISYTSSATANTDETKNQTITQNPTDFRNATGYWKMKVKGVKATTIGFDFKADWVVFKTTGANNFQLDLNGVFTVDLSTYPLAYIQAIEIALRYRSSDSGEKWFLKAYNWTSATYSDNGFNSTDGQTPTTGWDYYAVNVTTQWRSYVHDNGTMYVKVVDQGADALQTTLDIDFLGVSAKLNGAQFTFKNEGSASAYVVSIWIINSTLHKHYDADVVLNSAETYNYIRADVKLPSGTYSVKVVTGKGNIAVYTG